MRGYVRRSPRNNVPQITVSETEYKPAQKSIRVSTNNTKHLNERNFFACLLACLLACV